MTAAALPGPLLAKEARALLPIWLAAAAAMVPGAVTGTSGLAGWSLLACTLGSVAIGALSLGHEYAHGTLGTLLAQPIPRSRLLRAKLLVLVPLLLLLAGFASLVLLRADPFGPGRDTVPGTQWAWMIVALGPLLGLGVAPWLTMACRNVMAGVVFTCAVPAVLWMAGQIARTVLSGFDTGPLEYAPALTVMAGGTLLTAAVGALWGRTLFLRLEAPGTPGDAALAWPRGGRPREAVAARRHRSPFLPLVAKELRLQSLVVVVAGLYAAGWIGLSAAGVDAHIAGQSFQDLAGMYACLVAILAGAVASAEERALGTHGWQMLQPCAFWKQWAIKIGTAVLLAFVLGTGLATALEWGFPMIRDSGSGRILVTATWLPGVPREGLAATAAVVLTSLYVSSLSAGGLRAFLAAIPVLFVVGWLYLSVWVASYDTTYNTVVPLLNGLFGGVDLQAPRWWQEVPAVEVSQGTRWRNLAAAWLSMGTIALFLATAGVLGYRNHQSAGPRMVAALRQLTGLAALVALGSAAAAGIPTLLLWLMVSR